MWLWLDTSYACGGIAVQGDRVVAACPIYRRFMGQHVGRVLDELKRKRVFRSCKVMR